MNSCMRNMTLRWALLIGALVAATVANAAPPATIEIAQSPAWLEHGGHRIALAPGQIVEDTARIVTGAQARVVIRLAEGSTVKLGEDTLFSWRSTPDADRTLYRAALNVLKGAFRFTTTALGKDFRRDIRATVGTATIGIRGTDVWGKAADDRDFVVLIEGAIEITRADQTVSMSTPQTLFNAPKNLPADPIEPVDGQMLAAWAQETEPQAGTGIVTLDGRWGVIAGEFLNARSASALVTILNSAGYRATVSEHGARDTRYQVVLSHFATAADAAAIVERLKSAFPTINPSVTES